eukprot:854011_1
MSSSETEGAENTDEELSSTDLESYNDNNEITEEEFPLQQDLHQQNLIAIHITEKRRKGEGEINGLRYMIVDNENDEYDEEDYDIEKRKPKKE